ncbi:MAG: hypothetical protein ABSF38_04640 [Verrucomicrobiota bacterium]
MKADARVVNTTIHQVFYRNGQARERTPLRNARRNGVARTWHKNGVLATEEPYQNGLLHGLCRQWGESGKLLGEYEMIHGTGVQKSWHDNGKIQLEVSTVRGQFCGRNRLWLRDGTLISERFYLHGRIVDANTYRASATTDTTLPRFRGKPARLPPKTSAIEKRIHRVFVSALLEKHNWREAGVWFQKESTDMTARLLGRFKRESKAKDFVSRLYQAGAIEVIVPDVYRDKTGNQFADGLLVRLSRDGARRKAVRRVCAQLRQRKLGASQPDKDVGETHLYLSMV